MEIITVFLLKLWFFKYRLFKKLWFFKYCVEPAIVLSLFIVSYWIALTFMLSNVQFKCDANNQNIHSAYLVIPTNLGPAAMFACGYGFKNPVYDPDSALGDFLLNRTDRLDKEDIPEDISTTDFQYLQMYHIYLLFVVGLFWAIVGVSHSSLVYLFSLFFAFSTIFCYGILRMGSGRVLSSLFALFFAISMNQMSQLWYLRDYSKSTFFFLLTFLLILPVRREFKLKSLFVFYTFTGFLLGFSIGIRIDLMIFACFFPLVILLFLKGKIAFRWKMTLLFSFLLSFVIAVLPIFLHLSSRGSSLAHVSILGLGAGFDKNLGIHGDHYQFNYLYSDGLVYFLVQAHAMLKFGVQDIFYVPSLIYDKMSMDYFLCVNKNFPADTFLRIYSAIYLIFNNVFTMHPSITHSGYVIPEPFTFLVFFRREILDFLHPVHYFIPFLFFMALAFQGYRTFFFTLFFTFIIPGYTCLQFSPRHIFHLEIISLFMVAFCLNLFFYILRVSLRSNFHLADIAKTMTIDKQKMLRAVRMTAGTLAIILCSIYITRIYQQYNVEKLFSAYKNTPVTSLNYIKTDLDDRTVLVQLADNPPIKYIATGQPDSQKVTCLDVRFNVSENDSNDFNVSFVEDLFYAEHTFDVPVAPLCNGDTKTIDLFYPYYDVIDSHGTPALKFKGIIIPKKYESAFSGFFMLDHLDNIPLLFYAYVPDNFSEFRLYKKVSCFICFKSDPFDVLFLRHFR